MPEWNFCQRLLQMYQLVMDLPKFAQTGSCLLALSVRSRDEMLLWHRWTADFSFSQINYSESDQYIMFSPVCSHAFRAGFRGICDICNDCNIIYVRNYAVLPEKVTAGTLFHTETGRRLEDGAKILKITGSLRTFVERKKKLRWCNYYFTFRKGLCSGGTVH